MTFLQLFAGGEPFVGSISMRCNTASAFDRIGEAQVGLRSCLEAPQRFPPFPAVAQGSQGIRDCEAGCACVIEKGVPPPHHADTFPLRFSKARRCCRDMPAGAGSARFSMTNGSGAIGTPTPSFQR